MWPERPRIWTEADSMAQVRQLNIKNIRELEDLEIRAAEATTTAMQVNNLRDGEAEGAVPGRDLAHGNDAADLHHQGNIFAANQRESD